jgi:hypothetical protein
MQSKSAPPAEWLADQTSGDELFNPTHVLVPVGLTEQAQRLADREQFRKIVHNRQTATSAPG